ncbi:MAG: EAL domain-containing protein, partial [Acidimicrobiia bacterium]|nr:EAL domain-containing protein [Acidimicrobiia bacterium]
ESVLMQDAASSDQILRSLRDLGVRIAIDDFGTGYSSLSYLRQFSVDVLKIDRCFVSELGGPAGDSLVDSMVSLGGSLGLVVVAEGVEESAQFERLSMLGCDLGQGYLFAPPLAPTELRPLLEEAAPWAVHERAPRPRPHSGRPAQPARG